MEEMIEKVYKLFKDNAENVSVNHWINAIHEDKFQNLAESMVKLFDKPSISYFVDENGNNVDVNAEGLNVNLKRDGTLEYYRSFGFAGRKELTPVMKPNIETK